MKRIVSIMLMFILVLNFAGCSKGKDSKVSKNNSEKVKYTDDQILFAAQGRIDMDDDYYTVYSYNYKGELLDSSDPSSAIDYYSANGLAPALDQNTGKVGFVDKDGVFVIDPIYEDAAPFSDDGIALAVKNIGEDNKYGYINSKGEEIIPFIYDIATSFYNFGYALVGTEKNYDEADEYGKFHTYLSYDYVIDEKGKIVYEIEDEMRIGSLTKDYLVGMRNEKQTILDYSGKELLSLEWLDMDIDENIEKAEYISVKNDTIVKDTYKQINGVPYIVKSEIFDGKKFVSPQNDYEITSKHVATTINGIGFGVTKNGETVIPFEYDSITEYGEYFVAVKYNNIDDYYDQVFDIYDKEFNKTASDLNYVFCDRNETYGSDCQLPNGYFQIVTEYDSEMVYGIVDYTGKFIVEPVFSKGIKLWSYESRGRFNNYY